MNNNNNNGDELYYKVFKNQYLFYKIYSHVKTSFCNLNTQCKKYDELTSISMMIGMGQFELIRYKVKRNEYLTLGNSNLNIKEYQFPLGDNNPKLDIQLEPYLTHSIITKINLYKNIKKQEDQYFYHCLFKNYKNYFTDELYIHSSSSYPLSYSKKLQKEGFKKLINKLIEYDCLGGLLALVNDWNVVIKESHLLLSFKFNSFSICKYIIENQKQTTINNKFWKLLKQDVYPNIREYYKKLSFDEIAPKFRNFDCKIQFLINILNVKQQESNKQLKDIFYVMDDKLMNITIDELINSCITISFLQQSLLSSSSLFSKEHFKLYNENKQGSEDYYSIELVNIQLNEMKNYNILSIKEIKEIGNSIPDGQLSIKLIDINCKYNLIIKPLIQMVSPMISISQSHFSSFVFYYIRFLIGTLELVPKEIASNKQMILLLLQYSQDSSDCKIKFLKSLNIFNDPPIDYFIGFIELFIKQQDQKCLEFILCNSTLNHFISSIYSNINNIEIYKLLYNHFPNSFKNLDIVLLLKKNYNCIRYYKQLYPLEFDLLLTDQITSIKNSLGILTMCQLLYDNLSYFSNNNNIDIFNNIIPNQIKNQIESLSFNQFKFLFYISSESTIQSFNIFKYYHSSELYINFTMDEVLLVYYYFKNDDDLINLINDENETNQLFLFKNSSLLFSMIGRRCNLKILSIILSKPVFSKSNITNEYINYLNPLFLYSSFSGQIGIFNFIFENYPHLFFKQSTIFKICKRYSVLNDHILLFELLNKQ